MNYMSNNKRDTNQISGFNSLYSDICSIIEDAREQAYRAVNVSLTLRNWMLGERIAREKLDGEERAEYGKQVIATLTKELTHAYGKGFERVSLYNYLKFYRCFPQIVDAVSQQSAKVDAVRQQLGSVNNMSGQSEIVNAVRTKSKGSFPQSRKILPWTHYRELIRVEDPIVRKWYEQEALREMWSTRTLHRNIVSQYYNRLLQSAHKDKVVDEMHKLTAPMQQDKLEFIKNPVVAEFLGLQSDADFTESELEGSIITHLQKFIMEMGKGFAFVGRQQHIRTDMGDFYIDLVFYNYILKCFFLVDLKTTQISHQDVGQMDMYIRMYDALKRTEGDNPTIGLLLCSDTSNDMARYSVLHGSDQIFQAKYLTYLPSKEELAHEIEIQKEIFRQQQANKD